MIGKIAVTVVDREGNKKTVSVGVVEPTQVVADAFAASLAALTGAKILSTSFGGTSIVIDDPYTPGTFDTVGHCAVLRFVDGEGSAFRVSIPAPIDSAFDEDEEVSVGFASDVKAMIEAAKDDVIQYRGGSLVSKKVSPPLTIPDLEEE